MPGQDVHRPTLAANAERDLRADLPTGRAKETRNDLDERRMILIEEAVECFTVEVQSDVHPRP